jgi:hypothetical protein
MKQIPVEPPIKGLCFEAAHTGLSHEYFEKFGIKFEEGCDQLDYFLAAKIELEDTYYEIFKYKRAPRPFTSIVVMDGSPEERGSNLIKFMKEFKMTNENITWIHPDLYEIKKL